jgi:hypothetical protein
MFWISGRILSLDLSLSLSLSLLLKEIMWSYWDLSYLLNLQEAMVSLMKMKMSHCLYIASLFIDGLIELVAILSGMISRIIKIATTLFSKISSLPPISMSFIS